LNSWLVRRLRRGGSGAVSLYVSFAFTSLFCGAFFAVAELVWALVRLGAMPAVHAGLIPVADVARWDRGVAAVIDVGIAVIGGLLVYGYTIGRRALAVTAELLRHTPFTVLRNAVIEIAVDGARLAVVGVDDLGRDWARGVLEHPALPPLARRVAASVPFIVLSHRPDCFRHAAELG